jgi:hypothetical protein
MRTSTIAVAVVLCVAVAGCGSRVAAAGTHSAVVAWVDHRAPKYHAPPDRVVPYPTSAPLCRAGDLKVRRARGGVATGNVLYRFAFTNVGRRPCLARGFPVLDLQTQTGAALHVRDSPDGTFFGAIVPADIAPGQSAELDLATGDVTCQPGGPKRVLQAVRVGDGVLHTDFQLGQGCGYWEMSQLGLPQRLASQLPPRPGSPSTLHISWSLRPSFAAHRVHAGSTLRYVVGVDNPTTVAVPLSPCPSYTLWFVGRHPIAASYYLNCSAVRVIRSGERIRFRMVQHIPRGAHGIAKLGWHLNTPNEPGAAATVTVGS